MHDTLYCGKRFRTLNIIDEGTRECLAIEIDTSLPAGRVIRVLERLQHERGLPQQIRVDNDPELIAAEFYDWCENNGIEVVYIQPGKPQQNGFVERSMDQCAANFWMRICLKRYRRFARWRGSGCSTTTTSDCMKVWAICRQRCIAQKWKTRI